MFNCCTFSGVMHCNMFLLAPSDVCAQHASFLTEQTTVLKQVDTWMFAAGSGRRLMHGGILERNS